MVQVTNEGHNVGISAVSSDGRYILYDAFDAGRRNAFLWDRETGDETRVTDLSTATTYGSWIEPLAVTDDGETVLYVLYGENAAGTRVATNVMVWERTAGASRVIPVGMGGEPADADTYGGDMSADGRWFLFWSRASNIVAGDSDSSLDGFIWDRMTGESVRIPSAVPTVAGLSDDGRVVVFSSKSPALVSGDTNRDFDVFVWAR